ncbi:hypothetical protein [Lacticaseibacillus hulanensis]|uniref:hypothetical protein n=1 Tax=Lacticaseibacillus hulanensis TaxID=2493111 RepID=UPI000FDA8E69|nr:hypothetical protein [Lacticaseibacillus hulanensis]
MSSKRLKIFSMFFAIYIFLSIVLQTSTLSSVIPGNWVNAVQVTLQSYLMCVLVMGIILGRKYNLTFIMTFIALMMLAILISIKTGYYSVITSILAMMAGYYVIDMRIFVRRSFIARAIGSITVICLYIFGVIPTASSFRNNGMMRNSLGFFHPNFLGAMLLALSLEFVFIKWNNLKKIHTLFPIVCLLVANFVADSRGAVVGLSILTIACFCKAWFIKLFDKSLGRLLIICVIPMIFALSWLLMIHFDFQNKWLVYLDHLLSLRLSFGNSAYLTFGQHLFGSEIGNTVQLGIGQIVNGYGTIVLDNAYMSLLMREGIIYALLYAAFFELVIFKSVQKKNWDLVLMLVIFAAYGFFEVSATNVLYNVFFLSIGMVANNNQYLIKDLGKGELT